MASLFRVQNTVAAAIFVWSNASQTAARPFFSPIHGGSIARSKQAILALSLDLHIMMIVAMS